MKLINVDDLFPNGVFLVNQSNPFESVGELMNRIANASEIDAVPVVRCKDCKHHEDEEIGMVYCPNAIGGWVGNEWFCADGERKDGDE